MRTDNWLPIVPERTKAEAGLPANLQMRDSRELVVGSSEKTSSPWIGTERIEESIDGVGVVAVSPMHCA